MKALHILHVANEGSAVSAVCSKFLPLILCRVGTACVHRRNEKQEKKQVRRDVMKYPVWDSLLALNCSDIEKASLVMTYLSREEFLAAKQEVPWVRGLGLVASRCEQLGAAVGLCRNSLDLTWAGTGLESGQEYIRKNISGWFRCSWGIYGIMFLSVWISSVLEVVAFIFFF